MSKTLYFYFSEDYRANAYYKVMFEGEDEDEDDVPKQPTVERDDIWSIVSVPLDTEACALPAVRVFIVCNENVRYVTRCANEDIADIFLQLHSHINDCGPFEVTGWTGSYKETGAYSDPVPITHPDILALDIRSIEKATVAIAVDSDTTLVDHMLMCPPT